MADRFNRTFTRMKPWFKVIPATQELEERDAMDKRAKIEETVTKWSDLARSTKPVSEAKAERALKALYKALEWKLPKIQWVDSPLDERYLKFLNKRTPGHTLLTRMKWQLEGKPYKDMRRDGYLSYQIANQVEQRSFPLVNTAFHLSGIGIEMYGMWAYYDFALNQGFMPEEHKKYITQALALAEQVAWWRPFNDRVVLARRPTIIKIDDQNRLHSMDGPAFEWGERRIYSSRGVRLPEYVIERPDEITVKKIMKQNNTEVRRVMMDQYKLDSETPGTPQFIKDAGGVIIDKNDKYGTLWTLGSFTVPHTQYPWLNDTQETIKMLEVINSTQEPDGTYKKYWLRIPPDASIDTAHKAVAWTFSMSPHDYLPTAES